MAVNNTDASRKMLEAVEQAQKTIEKAEKAYEKASFNIKMKTTKNIDLFGGTAGLR